MVSSGAFNYINVLEKACDASWMRNSAIANNLANVNTPGYKRKDVDFETYLQGAVSGGLSLDDIDTENAELAKNQMKYYTMLDSVSQEFTRLKSVMKAS